MGIDLIETTIVWALKGSITKDKQTYENKLLMTVIVKYFCCFISLFYYMKALKICSEMFRSSHRLIWRSTRMI